MNSLTGPDPKQDHTLPPVRAIPYLEDVAAAVMGRTKWEVHQLPGTFVPYLATRLASRVSGVSGAVVVFQLCRFSKE